MFIFKKHIRHHPDFLPSLESWTVFVLPSPGRFNCLQRVLTPPQTLNTSPFPLHFVGALIILALVPLTFYSPPLIKTVAGTPVELFLDFSLSAICLSNYSRTFSLPLCFAYWHGRWILLINRYSIIFQFLKHSCKLHMPSMMVLCLSWIQLRLWFCLLHMTLLELCPGSNFYCSPMITLSLES